MGPFSEGELSKRLNELRDSQKEIQNVSAWIVHHRANSRDVIKVWYKNFKQGQKARKLTYMYLANDVVQNSRRKGPEYSKEFGSILLKVYHHLASIDLDEKSVGAYGRLLSIWNERQIFEKKLLQEVTQLWNHKTSKTKQRRTSDSVRQSSEERRKSTEVEDIDEMLESPLRKLVKPTHEETITLSPRMGSPGSGDPPEPEELITALQELENAASSDAEVREKIAKLPPEVSEVSKLENLKSSQEGLILLQQVNEASELLSNYNGRLQDELKERKKVGTMVSEFLSAQKELLAQAEERLELYHEKLEKTNNLKDELKNHIAALPDIPVLPTSSTLAPLPNPGDLFQ